jgi:hypothetical protein
MEYRGRGLRPFLVNYGAIKGDRHLARFAARRFVLIDEGEEADLPLLRAENPTLPILLYKNIVALDSVLPEFGEMNRDEHAFLHAAEPASLSLRLCGDTVLLYWLPDRRLSGSTRYRVYGSADSAGTDVFLKDVDADETETRLRIPPSLPWVRVATLPDATHEWNYSLPLRVASLAPGTPQLALRRLETIPEGGTLRLSFSSLSIGDTQPDSVIAYCDTSRDNRFDLLHERFRLTATPADSMIGAWSVPIAAGSRGGYEFYLIAWAGGKEYRIPSDGCYSSNVNNRVRNGIWGFYAMNAGSVTWRRSFLSRVLTRFASTAYNGLFEDDTWFRVESWGVDAHPLFAYNDASWKVDMQAFLDSIALAIAPRPAYFNGLLTGTTDSMLLHAKGGMTEGFAYINWFGPVTDALWKDRCDAGLHCQHQWQREWLALAGAPVSNLEGRMYALASYLLVGDARSMYANASDYSLFAHYPEFDIPLGAPLETALTSVDELQHVDMNGVPYYSRRFEAGTVVVNPDPSRSALFDSLEWSGRRAVLPVGGISIDGGRIESAQAGRLLAPATSRVFLNAAESEALASPLFEAVEVTPSPAPADGATPLRIRARLRDDSHARFRSDSTLPLFVTAYCGALGGPKELRLRNDGSFRAGEASWYEGSFVIPLGAAAGSFDLPIEAYSTTGLVSMSRARVVSQKTDSANWLENFSFELDLDEDGLPDSWRPFVKGYGYDTTGVNAWSGRRSLRMRNDSTDESRAAFCIFDLNQTAPKEFVVDGWSKAVAVDGTMDNDYSLYCDIRYADGSIPNPVCAYFATGTHDWQYASAIVRPAKPVRQLIFYVMFRKHRGEAFFDHISLRDYVPPTGIARDAQPASILSEVYPNPLKAGGTLAFTLRRAARVRITLHDALGRELCEAVEGWREAGTHQLAIPSTAPASGVCLLRIEADGESALRRIMLVR